MNDLPQKQDASAAGGGAPGTFAFDPVGLTGDGLTYAILSQPSEGWAINNHDGSFLFDPVMDFRNLDAGESRRVSFIYQVSDGQGATQTATATLVVTDRSGAPPMVELSGDVVVGADPAPEPQPTSPQEPGFITETAEDTAGPEEGLPEATIDVADDLGAIELVDIESPLEKAPETQLDQAPGAWPAGMAVGEQQRRVENSLAEDGQGPAPAGVPEPRKHAAEAAVFGAPSPLAQNPADQSAAQNRAARLPAGSDTDFGETGSPDDIVRSGLAADHISDPAPVESGADGLETVPASAPVFGESDDAATDWAADMALSEPAQQPAELSADQSPVGPAMPESLDPIGADGYQSDQFPLSPADEAALGSVATPAHEGPIPDLAPESRGDNAFDDMADAEPMTSAMAESAPATPGVAAPDNAIGWGESGPKSFAYADVMASGRVGYRILSQPIEGRVEDRGDGSFTFEPGSPLLDMAIGEMCQVHFTYQVEIDGQDAECMKTTVTVIGTSDGPEPGAVSFGPGEAADPLDGALAAPDFTAAPATTDAGLEAAETLLPVGPADLGGAPESLEADFEEPAAPLPLGPADDRLEVAPAAVAPVGDGDLSDEMPPGTEPWPTLDPAIEGSLGKSHDDGPGVSLPLRPTSPVAELAAEHGTDVPDSIPAFLAGEPEPEAADSQVFEDSPGADQGGVGAPDAVGDESPAVEPNDAEAPQYLDDTRATGQSDAKADLGAATPAPFFPETEDILGTEGDAAPIEPGSAMDPPATEPEAFEEADAIKDEAVTPPVSEETVVYMEDTATDFSSPDEEPGGDDFAPLGARDSAFDEPPPAIDGSTDASSGGLGAPPTADPDAAIDLAAAYLKAQGADLSAPAAAVPSAQETDLPAAGEIVPEGQDDTDVLPGVTAVDMLKSVVGGSEGEAGDAGGEIEDGDRIDTLYVDGVNAGPGVGGWDLELTEGSIAETHDEYMLLSSGAAGVIVLDGNVGQIKFKGIERIVW